MRTCTSEVVSSTSPQSLQLARIVAISVSPTHYFGIEVASAEEGTLFRGWAREPSPAQGRRLWFTSVAKWWIPRQDVVVAPRLTSILDKPIAFAHRGAKAHGPENTIETFKLALELGATGIESDVWITADDVAVLDHDGQVGSLLRRKAIRSLRRSELPPHIPSLDEFYDQVGTTFAFSLDVKDPAAFEIVVDAAQNVSAEENLWLCHPEVDQLVQWRNHTDAKLVDSTRLAKIGEGPERRAAKLRSYGIDAVNLRNIDWTGGLATMFHRFGRYGFGWDAQQPREIASLIDIGLDGIFSDHVDRLNGALQSAFPND